MKKTGAFNYSRFWDAGRKYHLFYYDTLPIELPIKSLCNRQEITQAWDNVQVVEYNEGTMNFATCELCKRKLETTNQL